MNRVFQVSTVHPRRDTRIFYRECISLKSAGYEVFLLVADGLGDEIYEGIQILDLGRQSSRWRNIREGYKGILEKVKELRPSIIHFHDPELMFVGRTLYKRGFPVIFDIHENIAVQILDKSYIPKWLRRPLSYIYRKVENIMIRRFHLIIAEHSYHDVYSNKGKSVTTVLNMPEKSHFQSYVNTARKGKEIFYIGGVSKERGLDITLEALNILNDREIDFYMHYMGRISDPINPQLLDRVSDKVKFYGWMDSKDGYEISKSCIVGLSVLKPIKNYVGSYSTKIFEYMAIGLPVITSNFPLYQDVVERFDTGFCIDPFDATELADKIQALIENPALARTQGLNGIKAVHDIYNWSAEERRLLTLYKSLF